MYILWMWGFVIDRQVQIYLWVDYVEQSLNGTASTYALLTVFIFVINTNRSAAVFWLLKMFSLFSRMEKCFDLALRSNRASAKKTWKENFSSRKPLQPGAFFRFRKKDRVRSA